MPEYFINEMHIHRSRMEYKMAPLPDGWIGEGDHWIWEALCGEWFFAPCVTSGRRKNRKRVTCEACLLLRFQIDAEHG